MTNEEHANLMALRTSLVKQADVDYNSIAAGAGLGAGIGGLGMAGLNYLTRNPENAEGHKQNILRDLGIGAASGAFVGGGVGHIMHRGGIGQVYDDLTNPSKAQTNPGSVTQEQLDPHGNLALKSTDEGEIRRQIWANRAAAYGIGTAGGAIGGRVVGVGGKTGAKVGLGLTTLKDLIWGIGKTPD